MGLVRKIKAGLVKVSVNDFVGEDGNVFFDIDDGVMRLSDGTTPGGIPLSSGGEGGASTFRQLLDTPSSFTGAAGNFLKVNPQGSAIEFVDVDLFDGDYDSLTNTPTLFDPSAIDQSLLPDTDVAYDLGSATNKWRDLYLSGNTIYLGNAVIRNVNNTVELPANARINGRKIPLDINELDDSEGRLGSSGVSDYNDLTNLPTLFSGSYTDLTDKPTIPTDISQLADSTNLLAGAGGDGSYTLPTATDSRLGGIKIGTGLSINGSGVVSVTAVGVTSYNDLTDTPTIPADISDLTDTTNLLGHFSGAYADLTGAPDLSVYQLTANAFSGAYADLTGLPTLVTSYNDLTDTPTIPVVPTTISAFTNDSGYITDYTVTQADVTQYQAALSITESQISDLQSYLTSVAFADLTSKPTTISGYGITDAFDGNYNSLTNLPTLVTSYNDLTDTPTLFSGAYADLTGLPTIPVVPTTLSAFTNDSGYITDYAVTQADVTQHQSALTLTESQISDLQSYLTSVAFADLTTTPTTLSGYGITDAYTITQVDTAITAAVNEILGDAPALLDTLGEIADAVGDDANFVTTINNAISLKANSTDLAVVATTGSYDDLANTPAIPTDISELTDNNNRLSSNITEDDLITYSLLFG